MTPEEYQAQWDTLNAQCKSGALTTDQLLAARRELTAQRDNAAAEAKTNAKMQATAVKITQGVVTQSRATSEHELAQRLKNQGDRGDYLERCARKPHVPPEVMCAALELLDAAKDLENRVARMLAVR